MTSSERRRETALAKIRREEFESRAEAKLRFFKARDPKSVDGWST